METLRVRFSTRQAQQVFKTREIELSAQDLQRLIDQHLDGTDESKVSVGELLDYLKGRGEFASYVGLTARHEHMDDLLNGVAQRAFAQQPICAVVSQEVFDDGREQDVRFKHFKRIT